MLATPVLDKEVVEKERSVDDCKLHLGSVAQFDSTDLCWDSPSAAGSEERGVHWATSLHLPASSATVEMVSMASQRGMNPIESFSVNPRKRNTKKNVPAIGISTTYLLLLLDTSSPTKSGALKESKELMTKNRRAQPAIQRKASGVWLETRFEVKRFSAISQPLTGLPRLLCSSTLHVVAL